MNIEKLVKQARKGKEEAFEQLLSLVREKLYRTAYMYVRNEQDALDLYQDTIYEAYVSLHKLRDPAKFQSWIVRMIVFKSIDFIRKATRQIVVSEEVLADLCVGIAAEPEVGIDLGRAFEYLDTPYKTVLLLRYYHDLSIKEIADVLQAPEGTIKSQLSRAKQMLRPILQEDYLYD